MAADDLVQEVWDQLQVLDADQLDELAVGMDLPVANEKKGDKRALFNIVTRYLSSEDLEGKEDKGQSVFLKVNDVVKAMLADDKKKVQAAVAGVDGSASSPTVTGKAPSTEATKPKTTQSTVMSSNSETVDSNSFPRFGKFKEFKINGSVCGNAKDRIDFDDLRQFSLG